MDIKLELVAIPVTDIDRAKDFYVRLGFNADHDHTVSEDLRFVQLTPPGSACSICIGKGITDAEPGSVVGMQVVVKDIEEAEREFKSRGIDISPIDDQA
ncbi:glyoxalase, partial [Rhodococcus erythropolis]|nr:glyoxalase [Rhodococcus erythropolis]